MKAMVLAAGLGERMWPLTEERAKPSLPLINRPLIAHTLEHLARHASRCTTPRSRSFWEPRAG